MNGLAPALPLPLATGHEATLEGKVKKIVYDSPDGRMRVFEVELDDKTIETVRQFDNIHPINKNDQIRIFGKVVLHKRWGRQFQARDVLKRIPDRKSTRLNSSNKCAPRMPSSPSQKKK